MTTFKGRVLCTEDDPDTRELIIFVLQQQGYDVHCTNNAADALRMAQTGSFDLYLMDSWLPTASGTTLTFEIRKFDDLTPILFYSGAAYDADKERARDAGAQGYLVKPVENDLLVSEVARLIAEANVAARTEVAYP